MKDINGGELRKGGMAMLLCEVLDVEDDHVHVRVMNSQMELAIGVRFDEVLDGLVADSELTAFEPASHEGGYMFVGKEGAIQTQIEAAIAADDQADGVKTCPTE